MQRRALLASLSLALLSAGPAFAQTAQLGHLRQMVPLEETFTRAVALADLDGDGDLDLFSADQDSARVYRYDDETGYLEIPGAVGPIASGLGEDVVLADFDGDGHVDALLAQAVSFGASLLQGDGTGAFALASGALPTLAGHGTAVAAADLDNDGDLDAVLGYAYTDGLVLQNAGGVFSKSPLGASAAAWAPVDLEFGDVDADGDADALAAAGDVFLYVNDGALGFSEVASAFPPAGLSAAALALADLDGDGDLDLVVGNDDGADLLYAGDGLGGFAPHAAFPALDAITTGLVAVDYDGDLDLDVIASTRSLDPGILYENQGGLVFHDGSSRLVTAPHRAESIAAGDVDGDGDPDVVLGTSGPMRLLLGSGALDLVDASIPWPSAEALDQLVVGDWNGDGWNDAAVLGVDLLLYHGDGAGGMLPAPASAVPAADAESARDLLSGDLDGDGDLDLLLTAAGKPSRVYDNDGAGGFVWDVAAAPPVDLQAGEGALGDLDGDGDLDAYAARGGSDVVLRNDGAGNLTAEYVASVTSTLRVALGDLDQDGDLDVYCGAPAWGTDAWFANDGTGVFEHLAGTFPTSSDLDVLILDLEDDGDLDVLASGLDALSLWRNEGGGAFSDQRGAIAGDAAGSRALTPFDFDGDGDLDVLVPALTHAGQTYLLVNDGAGGLVVDTTLVASPATSVRDAAVADLDLDGDADVMFSGTQDARILTGLQRQLARRAVPRIGKPLGLDVFGPAGELWVLAYSSGIASIDLGAFGTLRLDPASIVLLASGVLDGQGRAGFTAALPNDPVLVGVPLGTQAAVGNEPVFTNLERIVATTL